jgi:hypothetical protein
MVGVILAISSLMAKAIEQIIAWFMAYIL